MSYLRAEAEGLAVLGRLLQTYPNTASLGWLQDLAEGQVLTGLSLGQCNPIAKAGFAAMESWLRGELATDPSGALEAVQYEHTRLFIGPGEPLAPLWESVYIARDPLLFQAETRDVRSWYGSHGVAAQNPSGEPDDHLGLEFSFLGLLAARAEESAPSDPVHQRQRSDAAEFWRRHPGRWVEAWADRVVQFGRHEFHLGLASAVRGTGQWLTLSYGVKPEPLPTLG